MEWRFEITWWIIFCIRCSRLLWAIFKKSNSTAEVAGGVIGNKIANRVTKVSSSPQNNSETITNEHDKETPKERYITPEER